MKSTSRAAVILGLGLLLAASGCTQSDFLNPGTYPVTLVTTVDDAEGFECVLFDILELRLEVLDPEPSRAFPILALAPSLGGEAGGVNRGVRQVNFASTSCPTGQCSVTPGACATNDDCSARTGTCDDSPNIVCQRDIDCPDTGFGTDECDSVCDTSLAYCFTNGDADCAPGDTCDIPSGFCLTTPRSCDQFPTGTTDFTRRCDGGDTCLPVDVCNRFNSRPSVPAFFLPAGTYRIVSLVPASYSLRDIESPENSRSCGLPETEDSSKEIVGLANDSDDDLVFTVGPGQLNQIVLEVLHVEELADELLTPDQTCYTNDLARYFDLRDPADGV